MGAGADAALEAALAAAPIASVLLVPAPGEALKPQPVKAAIDAVQRRNIAALVADDADLARVVRADGVHLTWTKDQPQRYRDAREVLGARALLGADAGRSRDDAMSLGEDGADYVAFGIPAHVEDRETAFGRQCELVDWWAEIFEVPCVALDAETPEAAAELAAARADFVAVRLAAGLSPAEAAQRVSAFAAAVAQAGVSA
jgi:thiamine-phosphate pyrophosphorylase